MKLQRVSAWAEILSSVAVLASLLFLLVEVRMNTRATMHQSALVRAETSSAPFLDPAVLIAAMMKVQAVDGASGVHEAFIDRYDMSMEEAITWQRHLGQMWSGLRADLRYGDRETAEQAMRFLLTFPDNRTYVENSALSVEYGYLLDESATVPATR